VLSFDDEPAASAWIDEWVHMHLETAVTQGLPELERQHFGEFSTEYGRFVGQFEIQFSALASVVDQLNFVDKSAWPQHRPLQYVLVAYNLRSFVSALDRLARGYYEDCFAITRGLYETFVRLMWMSCHSEQAFVAVVRNAPAGLPQFNVTNFLRDQLKLEWGSQYSVLSAFAHSNSYGVLQAMQRNARREDEPERFGLGLAFRRDLAEAAIPLLQFVLLTHLRFVIERLVGHAELPRPEVSVLAAEAAGFLMYVTASQPNRSWRQVASDLDRLFAMLAVADAGGDWRAALRS
jgi:hypothetical protein